VGVVTRRPRAALCVALPIVAVVVAACGSDGGGDHRAAATATDATPAAATGPGPPAVGAKVDHRLFPLPAGRVMVLVGRELDTETGERIATRSVARVLRRKAHVAGVRATVVAVKDFEDGELVESTHDFYAQRRDGSVLYLGERVNDIEGGKVVGHGGQWVAGRNGAKPGLFMPAHPRLGRSFAQERAPGVAEDTSTIVAIGRTVRTPVGTFAGCVKTRDYSPLDKLSEFKFYCPRVGLVREDVTGGRALLVRLAG
jgi:hypothetical protein